MESFITIAIFDYPHEIAILKHRLDQEGLHYYFENEATASIVPMYSIALGGIKLKIHPNDSDLVKTNSIRIQWKFKSKNRLISRSCQHLLKTTKRKFKFKLIFNGYYSVLIAAIN